MKFLSSALLLVLTTFFPTVAFALNFLDFYDDNGQLIEVLQPPYFDTNYNYCERHVLNSPYTLDFSFPYSYISWCAENSLRDAVYACRWHQTTPPPYYWVGKKTYGYRDRWMSNFISGFFCRYSPEFRGSMWKSTTNWPYAYCMEYSEYVQKFSYLFYWFDLSYSIIKNSLGRELQKNEDELRGLEEENYKGRSVEYLKEDIAYLREQINGLKECRFKSFEFINNSFEEITDLFLCIYNNCIEEHAHPIAIYERGRIYFDRGETTEFIANISQLVALGHSETPQIVFELGKAYNDANQYNQAIKILSEVIEKDPLNKEAYFERATAYFETGNVNLALADYLSSEIHPNCITSSYTDLNYLKLAQGIGLGCLKGGCDSAIDFVPSLFATAYGLGKGLWALASNPIGVSKELVNGCVTCIEFIKDNISKEILAQVAPELKEFIEKWDQLEEEKKGYYIGYVIGRYGVDILAWGGCARGIKLFRDVRRANTTLTLESATVSARNLEELTVASEQFSELRTAFKKKCKIDLGSQNKHIRTAHNFKNEGELTVSIEKIAKLSKNKLGEGIPIRLTFGEANYKELVNFEEIIGIHVNKGGVIKIPTSLGEIHYKKTGEYHVVPVNPEKIKYFMK